MNERADYIAGDEPNSPVVLMIPNDLAGLRLDQALARLFPAYSRSRLQAWLREGRIQVDGVSPDARRKVWGGERVELASAPTAEHSAQLPEDIPLQVVFEDEHLLVINKPAGLVVHPGNGNWSGTLLNALLHHAPELADVPRAGIVHRLDKDTSGLLVVARTATVQLNLIEQMQARSVKRVYRALVHGKLLAGGTVDASIGRHPTRRTRMAVVADGRSALTHYRIMERFVQTTLLECRLETGRTHQIRVHMAHVGHPLVGDPAYGGRRAPPPGCEGFERQALHAFCLGLLHPGSAEFMQWEAPMAQDFIALLQRVRAAT